MNIGIAFDLKSDFAFHPGGPDDALEEYDSEATVEAIAEALRAAGHTPTLLGGGRELLQRVLARPPDLVFNIAEGAGTRSREAHVPSVLEMLRVPFTHSDPLTLALTMDKGMAKRIVSTAGVPTPAFFVVERPEDLEGEQRIRFPVLVKPLFEGSSMGIRDSSRVVEADELRVRIASLLRDYGQPVLVEEFCPGAEFTVGVSGSGRECRPIGVMEILPRRIPPELFVYSLEVKRNYLEEIEYRVPPDRPAEIVASVTAVALDAYRALGCRDVARVDVRIGDDGRPKFLEVNPLPGLNPISGDLVILAERSGLPYQQLIARIVDSARERYGI